MENSNYRPSNKKYLNDGKNVGKRKTISGNLYIS